MARRGEQLREHILWTAMDVFLEMGFQRASMDVVASRAETSKRSLYAHFESKEKLFLEFLEHMRRLFLGRLKMPGDYSEKPAEALTLFCGRYLEIVLCQSTIRMCRVVMAETERFPEGSAVYFNVGFSAVQERLTLYLKNTFRLSAKTSADAAERLLGLILYPRFPRALFGLEALPEIFNEENLSPNFDLKPIRAAVANVIKSLAKE